jgi:dihydrofolate reductase
VHVALIAVQSLDGCITRHDTGGAGGWASPEDQDHFRRELASCDCAVFGAGTYRADRAHIRPRVRPELLRMVMTRRPTAPEAAADAVPGQLEFTDRSPADLLAELERRGRRRCALLGGEQVYGRFLAEGLVDELVLTVEPVLFGAGRRLVGEPLERRFVLADVGRLNPSTLLLRYRRPPAGEGPGR